MPEVDTGIAPEHRWLFRGRSDHQPLTTRQFSRLFKEAAKAAGLRKTVSLHFASSQLCGQPARVF
jgi:integrase/recombinase XerD